MEKFFNLLLISLFLIGCSGKSDDNVVTIHFPFNSNEDILKNCEVNFLKLETNESCLIDKSISQIELYSDKFIILTGGKRDLLVFNTDGSFISPIGAKGIGPGEYVIPASFSINPETAQISVSDIAQKKIINYDLKTFDFVSEDKMIFDNFCFEYLGNDKIIWKNIDYQHDHSQWNFILTDFGQNFLNGYINKEFKTGYSSGRLKTLYQFENKVIGYMQYNPILYGFNRDGVYPYCKVKLGKFEFPPIDYLKKAASSNNNFIPEISVSDYISEFSVYETANSMLVYYLVSQRAYVGLYDKIREKTNNMKMEDFEKYFQVGKIFNIVGTANNNIIAVLNPFDLLNLELKKTVFNNQLLQLIKTAAMDDNPILMFIKLKS